MTKTANANQTDFRDDAPSGDAYFDPQENAWILSRYKDVAAAFHSDVLQPIGIRGAEISEAPDGDHIASLRDEARAVLSRANLASWMQDLERLSRESASQIARKQRVDLFVEHAKPLGTRLAVLATQPPPNVLPVLLEKAHIISDAAADPVDTFLEIQAKECQAFLDQHFLSGPSLFRGPAFVGLSQTFPRLLARFWLALLQNPGQAQQLREDESLWTKAIEELFRYAGITKVLWRVALADVNLNGTQIRKGERLLLRVEAANRDCSHFACADSLAFDETHSKHLALGLGAHACVAAPLLRMAAQACTAPILHLLSQARIDGEIRWRGGIGFRYPQALLILLPQANPSN